MRRAFFLIFSKDPQILTETFAKQGIIVRNKHDEIPNAIRISMPSLEIMKTIMAICEKINKPVKQFTPNYIFVDLDGTLRSGSFWEGLDIEALKAFRTLYTNHNTYILTNNTTHSKQEIADILQISERHIITPINGLLKHLNPGSYVYVIGNRDTISSVNQLGYKTYSYNKQYDAILIANTYFMTCYDWEIISNNKRATVFITDNCRTVTRKYCSDLKYNKLSEDDLFPDIGSYTDIIKSVYHSKIVLLGKPNADILHQFDNLENSVFIGDSLASDIGLANKLNATGFLIHPTKPVGYCPLDDCHVVRHIKDISFL